MGPQSQTGHPSEKQTLLLVPLSITASQAQVSRSSAGSLGHAKGWAVAQAVSALSQGPRIALDR